VHAFPAPPSQLNVSLISLTFKSDIATPNTKQHIALNKVLNDIVDSVESSAHPTTFTSWSPSLSDPRTAVIISTAIYACSASSPLFDSLHGFLTQLPHVQHIYLDYSILSLAASGAEQRVPCDIITLQAPNPGVAAAIGKHFGWDPKKSSLALQMSQGTSAAFSRPGDLIKDFWAWAELRHEDPMSPSTIGSSFASSHESLPAPSQLMSWNSDEKNMSLPFPEVEQEESNQDMDDETLVMIFQWSNHEAGDRFKHPLQISYGENGELVRKDLWDSQVAHPIRQLQLMGAKSVMHKLELRAVEPRVDSKLEMAPVGSRVRSGSKRLSMIASGLSDKVSGLWR